MSNFLGGDEMDISDATASSIGTSPEELKSTHTENASTTINDRCQPLSLLTAQKSEVLTHDRQLNALNANEIKMTTTTPKSLQSESNENMLLLNNLHLSTLENDRTTRHHHHHNHNNQQHVQQRQAIERTLANSHPLMSPNGTDSESDMSPPPTDIQQRQQQHPNQQQLPSLVEHGGYKCPSNFPDVIPTNERRHVKQHDKLVVLPAHNKLVLLRRTRSPDILSSESETEISQYQAAVEADFQSVTLLPNKAAVMAVAAGGGGSGDASNTIGVGREDISSLDSISNHSFDDDEDMEHMASLSPSSSVIDGLEEDDIDNDDDYEGPDDIVEDLAADDAGEITTGTMLRHKHTSSSIAMETSPLPQYSAKDEHRDSRNWQKITLPDGRVREIDMRVIEPYKRVLSHGGYLKAGGHNAIVIFCACHLPDHSRADYNYVMDNLFLYVMKTLEQLVTEDYVLIYLHGGSHRRNVPPFPWLKKCYQLIDRRLRKSLKSMYLVHPTFWIRSIVWMARPFVSSKFWRKLVYVKTLTELGTYITVEKAAIPDRVKQYDARLEHR